MNKSDELKVFISSRDSTCEECEEDLGRSAWIILAGERGALCLACAELEHLPFLPSGNAALTRRAKKHSRRHAVVLKWSRARKRYERQGLLVEEEALAKAEAECLADEEVRQRKRLRSAERRKELDEQYVARFAEGIRELFPNCPMNSEQTIVEFACLKYSLRVGRSAAAKQLDEDAIRLAVIAHVRHEELTTMRCWIAVWIGYEARHHVQRRIEQVLATCETCKLES